MQTNELVSCPHCGHPFELSVAMRESVEKRLAQETTRIRDAADVAARERYAAQAELERQAREAELTQARQQVADAVKRETELVRRARELDEREQQSNLDFERRLADEAAKIRTQAETSARERFAAQAQAEIQAKEAELATARQQVADAAKREAELIRRARELDDREQQSHLDFEKRLTEETTRIRAQADATARERYAAQAREEIDAKDAELASARQQLSDAAKREADITRRARELDDREQQAVLDLERKLADERAKIRVQVETAAREHYAAQAEMERQAREAELTLARQQVADAVKRETELVRRARELDEREQQSNLDFERRLTDEAAKIRTQAETSARERYAAQAQAEIQSKEAELATVRQQVADATKREADLVRRARELDDREQQSQLDFEKRLTEETTRIRAQADATARERYAAQAREEIGAKDAELASARQQLSDAAKREADITRRARELDDREQQANLDLERKLADERAKIRVQVETATREHYAAQAEMERQAREAELTQARQQVADAVKRETELVRRARELDERECQARLDFERKLSEQAAQIRANAEAEARERLQFEQDKRNVAAQEHKVQIEGLQRKLGELQQRLAATPAHTRGEAQEVQLRDLLMRNFLRDVVEDVPVGAAGSDLIHHVIDDGGRDAGIIIWESKNTKAWSDEWLAKLRDDQRAIGAEVAVIVSAALPPDVRVFGFRDGVWITSWAAVAPVAMMLRRGILDVASARQANQSRGEKMSMLYDYLTGAEFRNRFLGVIEAYQEMQEDLEDEKRALLTIWKKRERQLRRAIENLSSFYGDVQGIAGSQLADIEPLSLPSGGGVAPRPVSASLMAEDDAAVADEVWPQLTNLLFSLIPADGTSIGNKNLSGQFVSATLLQLHLTVGPEEYKVCKDTLLAQRKIRIGPGQGGSVARLLP